MAALGSQSIASSYEQLLHVDANGGGDGTNHVSVKDGDNETTFGFTIASDALMMSSTNRLEFGDTGTYIHQSADGVLDLVSDSEIEINATTIDINGATDLSGDLTLAGDIVFNAADKGICLGVTSNTGSNTLDDYEEGNYNATVVGSSSGTGTLNLSTAMYTKIGRLVAINGVLDITADDISGDIRVSIPFANTAQSGWAEVAVGTCFITNGGSFDGMIQMYAQIDSDNSYFLIKKQVDAGTVSVVQGSEVDGVFELGFDMTYITDL